MGQVVWIVEDSPLGARIAREALTGGFECTVFPAGAEVLERISTGGAPDLLVLDWELPDISGLELCHAIRRTHHDLLLPILLLTGRRSTTDVVDGLSAGANDYVTKPYVAMELLARMKSLSRTQQMWRRGAELEARLTTTLRSIGDAVISTDAQGRVAFMNPIAEDLTRWRHADAIGQATAAVFPVVFEATRAPAPCPVEVVLREGTSGGLVNPMLLKRRDGSEVPIDDSVAPIRDESGALTGVVLVFRDVTAKKDADAQRERLLAEAELRGDFERQLIGIVSHDMRGPLGTVMFGTELLLAHESMDEKCVKTLLRMKSAAERGTRLVNDLLDFTQARLGGGIPVVRAMGDLHAMVHQVVEDLGVIRSGHTVRVTTTGEGNGSWDIDRLAQVVANLVGNALKYGSASSVVGVHCASDADGTTVSVHNGGPPISKAALERIFQPMQRATSELENAARSVGLGLFIVKHLVDAHGGHVTVTSAEEAGTTFAFWVPKRVPLRAEHRS